MFSSLCIKHSNLSEKIGWYKLLSQNPQAEAFEFLSLFWFSFWCFVFAACGLSVAFEFDFCRKTIMCVSYKGVLIYCPVIVEMHLCVAFYLCCSLSSWKIEQCWRKRIFARPFSLISPCLFTYVNILRFFWSLTPKHKFKLCWWLIVRHRWLKCTLFLAVAKDVIYLTKAFPSPYVLYSKSTFIRNQIF